MRHSRHRRLSHDDELRQWVIPGRLRENLPLRLWHSHPIFFASLLGGSVGLTNAAILALAVGQFSVLTSRFLFPLWPTSILAFSFLDGGSKAFLLLLLVAEFGGNALIYAIFFAAPGCLIVAVRRSFGTPEKVSSITRLE